MGPSRYYRPQKKRTQQVTMEMYTDADSILPDTLHTKPLETTFRWYSELFFFRKHPALPIYNEQRKKR
uniref:Uncharacterized protein n=1 Tax=Anguilla anguilla TaxID=7936 RepID=A0A0E9XX09_ANGAN